MVVQHSSCGTATAATCRRARGCAGRRCRRRGTRRRGCARRLRWSIMCVSFTLYLLFLLPLISFHLSFLRAHSLQAFHPLSSAVSSTHGPAGSGADFGSALGKAGVGAGSGRRVSSAATDSVSSFHATVAGVNEGRCRAALAELPADGAAGGRAEHHES